MISVSNIIERVNHMLDNEHLSDKRKDDLVKAIIFLICCTGFGFVGLFFYGLAKLIH